MTKKKVKTLRDLRLILCDENAEVVDAWRRQFGKQPNVEERQEDVLSVEADAILVPGNSFGFLDGGLGLRLSDLLGLELQDVLRKRIRSKHGGELLVGQAIVVRHSGQVVVYAPLWRTPQSVESTLHPFLCIRGGLEALRRDMESGQDAVSTLTVPGVGTGEPGQVHPLISARQIRYGYEVAIGARGRGAKNLTRLVRREQKLKSLPRLDDGEQTTSP